MLANAQRQRLQPLQEQEGVEGAERVAEVALQRDARLEDVGDRPERLHRLGPHRAVVARIGLVQHREALGVLLPVVGAAVDDEAADRVAVAADVLGRRIDDAVRAVVERSEEHPSELQSLMRISYAVFCLKQNNTQITITTYTALI